MWQFLIPLAYAADCNGAQPGDKGGVDLGCSLVINNETPVKDLYTNPAFLVNLIVRNLFVLAGVFLFILFFYAGFKFISEGTKGKDQAKSMLTSAVVGFVIMFTAYWIIQIIQVVTGVKIPIAAPTP